MARRRFIAAAIFLLLIVPLSDAVVCASARASASAPCCMGKGHSCPMRRHAAPGSWQFCSCGERGLSLIETPPAIDAQASELRRPEAPPLPLIRCEIATLIDASAPPDPPPPRHLG